MVGIDYVEHKNYLAGVIVVLMIAIVVVVDNWLIMDYLGIVDQYTVGIGALNWLYHNNVGLIFLQYRESDWQYQHFV